MDSTPSIDQFLHRAFDDTVPLDTKLLLTEFSQKGGWHAQPLFEESAMSPDLIIDKSPPLSQVSHTGPKECGNELPKCLTPNYIGFIYPTQQEILAEINNVHPGLQRRLDVDNNVTIHENQFDDSFPVLNLTQIMNVPCDKIHIERDTNEVESQTDHSRIVSADSNKDCHSGLKYVVYDQDEKLNHNFFPLEYDICENLKICNTKTLSPFLTSNIQQISKEKLPERINFDTPTAIISPEFISDDVLNLNPALPEMVSHVSSLLISGVETSSDIATSAAGTKAFDVKLPTVSALQANDDPQQSSLPPVSFMTASGYKLKPISSEAIARARLLLASDSDIPPSLTVNERYFKELNNGLIGDKYVNTTAPEVVTEAGEFQLTDNIESKGTTPSNSGVPLVSIEPVGFMTASGHKLKPVSSEAIERACLRLASDSEISFNIAMNNHIRVMSDNGCAVSTSETHNKSQLDLVKHVGFMTASGRKPKPASSEAIARARLILTSAAELPSSIGVGDGTIENCDDQVPTKDRSVASIVNKGEPTASSEISFLQASLEPVGFMTASGRKPKPVSSASIVRARRLVSDVDVPSHSLVHNGDIGLTSDDAETVSTSQKVSGSQQLLETVNFLIKGEQNLARVTSESVSHSQVLSVTDVNILPRPVINDGTIDITNYESDTNLTSSAFSVMQVPGKIQNFKNYASVTKACAQHYLESDTTDLAVPADVQASSPRFTTHDIQSTDLGHLTAMDVSPPANEYDSLVYDLEETQFVSQQLRSFDPELEKSRCVARDAQKSSIYTRLYTDNIPAALQCATYSTSCSSAHPAGRLWRLRSACKSMRQQHHRYPLLPWRRIIPSLTITDSKFDRYTFPETIVLPADLTRWSLRSASQLRWRFDSWRNSVTILLGDDVVVIPDKFGCIGKEEMMRAFLASTAVTARLISKTWLSNQLDQLLWKLGSCALLLPQLRPQDKVSSSDWDDVPNLTDYCSPHHLLLRLRYRYDRELNAVERPALRRIVELDDSPARCLTLCISKLDVISQAEIRGRLTDGWYQVDWQVDPSLARLIRSGRLRVGYKILTVNAELVITSNRPAVQDTAVERKVKATVKEEDEFAHLTAADGAAVGVALRLHGNSTRPAAWYSRLGFTSLPATLAPAGLRPVALCSLVPDGGLCTAIRIVVQRRFPLQYMETIENQVSGNEQSLRSRRVFRTERGEQAEAAAYDTKRRAALDHALNNLISTTKGSRRRQPTREELAALGNDGEELFTAVSEALCPEEAEADLTEVQRDSIRRHKEAVIQSAITETIPSRKVTPLLRVRVAGLHPRDVAIGYAVPLTVWNPTDEHLALLKEGEAVEIYKLQVSTTRHLDPFAVPIGHQLLPLHLRQALPPGHLVSLSGGGSSTAVRSLVSTAKGKAGVAQHDLVDENKITEVYEERHRLSVTDLYRMIESTDGNPAVSTIRREGESNVTEVDLFCLLVTVHTTSSSSVIGSKSASTDTPLSLNSVYVTDCDSEADDSLVVIKVWGSLQSHHLQSILQPGERLHFTDLQLRGCHKSPGTNHHLTSPISLHYTVASNVMIDRQTVSSSTPQLRNSFKKISALKKVTADRLNRLKHHAYQLYSPTPPSALIRPPFTGPTTPTCFPIRTHASLSRLLQQNQQHLASPSCSSTPQSLGQCLRRQPNSLAVLEPENRDHARMPHDDKNQIDSVVHSDVSARRTTPRTGLSRRGKRHLAITVASTGSLDQSGVLSPPRSCSTPLRGVADVAVAGQVPTRPPLSPLQLIDGAAVTPQPNRIKRERYDSPIRNTDLLLQHLSSIAPYPGPPELSSPIKSSSSPIGKRVDRECSQPSLLMSPTSQTADEEFDDLNASIADLVKTRQRCRPSSYR